jgi:hypothetical protein
VNGFTKLISNYNEHGLHLHRIFYLDHLLVPFLDATNRSFNDLRLPFICARIPASVHTFVRNLHVDVPLAIARRSPDIVACMQENFFTDAHSMAAAKASATSKH